MDISKELLFFFSLLGVFNGIIFSIYFLFFVKENRFSNKFLGALLLVLCVRIGKSVLLYFNHNLFILVIEIGVLACAVIGPLLYFYISSSTKKRNKLSKKHLIHFIPFLAIVTGFYINKDSDYQSNRLLILKILNVINIQWFIYLFLSGIQLKNSFIKLFYREKNYTKIEIWNISIFIGVFLVWLSYTTLQFTSYITGAVVFSLSFYVSILFLYDKKQEKKLLKKQPVYKLTETKKTLENINQLMLIDKVYKNSDLKMPDFANLLNLKPHQFSEFLNLNLNKNFASFINEYRIDEAKILLVNDDNYTIEYISQLCGFKSTSAFYTAFKKTTSITPAAYRNNY